MYLKRILNDKSTPSNGNFGKWTILKPIIMAISPFIIAVIGSAARGDTLAYVMLALVHWGGIVGKVDAVDANDLTPTLIKNSTSLGEWGKFKNVHVHVASAILSSFVMFYGLGGYLQWYYYILQRDKPEKWKCQPERFLTKENERHEILAGSRNMLLGSTVSGVITTYMINGGKLFTIYYNIDDWGWPYFVLSTVLVFLYQDAAAYYSHRYFHTPWFYKNIHKHHHRYHSPTAFGAVAMHPLEFTILQFLLVVPVFVIPVHFAGFLGCVMYVYYYGMIDHSGIDLEALWPWQPPVRFHDDHHKYFHVNFGFNTLLFDRFHDTLRKENRIYGENIFGGKGILKKKI